MYYENEQQQHFVENLMEHIIPIHQAGSYTGGFRKTRIQGTPQLYSVLGDIADDIICILGLYLYDGDYALADEQYFSYLDHDNTTYILSVKKKTHLERSVNLESINFIAQLS